MFLFFLSVVFTLIMLVLFGFLVMYLFVSLKLLRVSSREDSIDKKRSAQKSLLLSVSGMVLLFFVWVAIMSFIK
jgi:Ca2+/Na+ antiporter